MLAITRWVLKALLVLNILLGAVLLLVLAWSLVNEPRFLAMNRRLFPDGDLPSVLFYARVSLALVAPVMVAAHLLLGRLLAMLKTVEAGEPFVADNAERLRVIAWSLLAIQICDLGFGWATESMNLAAGERFGAWSPGLTGWVAVLLCFVLARVFREGTRLRSEAELTI